MKFSIVGSGFIFPAHVEAIRYIGGKIRDVVNTARGEDTWQDMIKTTDADCIVVLAPNDLHYPITKAAIAQGKTVLCEKPLTLNSQDAKALTNTPNVFSVLQLHYHPLTKQLEAEVRGKKEQFTIEMDISVYRDPHYYLSWKGKRERSGGPLFNLGSHYFDLLIHLFGFPTEMQTFSMDDKTGTGIIKGESYTCTWKVSTGADRDKQRRIFKINGIDYNFSSKDNLSFENHHRHVYEALREGRGVTAREALPSIELIEHLYADWDAKNPSLKQEASHTRVVEA